MNRDPLPGILVVDDEPPALDALARALKEDFCVFTAASASEAMLRLEQEPGIRIILCDQHLPDTSGIEFWPKYGNAGRRPSASSSRGRKTRRTSPLAATQPASGNT